MPSRFICDCGLEIAHCSYIPHVKSERHSNMMSLQGSLKVLKTELKQLKDLNEILKKEKIVLETELSQVIKNLVNKSKN